MITRSGLATDGAQVGGVKQPTTEWVHKSTVNPPTFDQAQRNFCNMGLMFKD